MTSTPERRLAKPERALKILQLPRAPKRRLPPLSNAYPLGSLIANLRERWHLLHDIDRALAVREMIHLGVSRRRLARKMGFSEGLIRHLLMALEAAPSDLELARQNAISTNELVRRARPQRNGTLPESPVSRPVSDAAMSLRRHRLRGFKPIPLFPLLPYRTWRKS